MPESKIDGMPMKDIQAALKKQIAKGVPRQTATSKAQPIKSSVKV